MRTNWHGKVVFRNGFSIAVLQMIENTTFSQSNDNDYCYKRFKKCVLNLINI